MTGFVHLFSPVSKWTLHSVVVVTLLVLLNLDSVLSAFYTNQVAVHIEGGPEEAHVIAKRHGFINLGQIGVLEDHYLFEHPHIVKRSTSASQEHGERLEAEPQVRWFEQQVVLSRKKRAFTETPYTMTDPNWSDQWYLNRTNHMDMNVIPAWLKGYTGKGVVITILDDGIERNHTDLVENYDPEASYDINDRDADPFPRYDYTNENRHGTRCAGEVSASANNSMCGVGVAFRSKIGGVRMLDGDVTDAVEAAALSLNPQHIDIYSASWGPDDDGKVVDGPGKLAKLSFLNGITKGRNGKGSIFVWASGNGGNAHDSCNCDGYTNSIFTLSVSSTSELGNKPWYLEECSSTLATTYSSGGYRQRQIVTTDLHNLCTKTHTGTSAAAPLAAGIVALVLEANPNLTWRDVQYITMLTARTDPFIDADFVVNSMGRKVSLRYGYGLMDTSAMVDLAESWTNVPLQHTCEKSGEQTNVPLTGTPYSATIDADGCTGQGNAIKFLEHVQINVTLSYSRRGDISLHLTSPKGTTSTLLPQRQNDRYTGAFQNWPFMSVHFWGEDPTGTWKLEINNEGAASNHGTLTAWSLRLHGTATDPLANTAVTTTQTGKPTLQPTPVTCHSECDGHCNGSKPEDCVKCKHYKLGEHGACVGVCPNSTFVNDVSRECVKCDGTCHTCRGSSGTDCNTCFGGWFLMTENSTCVMECPDGFYEEDPSGRCSHCAENCLTCQGTANTCTSCKAGEQLQNGACYGPGTCLETQFKNAEGLCEVCHITCGTCSGRTLHNCTSCVMDNSLTTYLEENMCVMECSHDYYVTHVNQLKLQSCERCDSSCLTCTGPAPSDCSSCQAGLTLTSGQCLSGNIDCAPDTYTKKEVQCESDSISINIPRKRLGDGKFLLEDPGCEVIEKPQTVSATFGLQECGTVTYLTEDDIVYKNYLTNTISGDSVLIECSYPRSKNLSTSHIPVNRKVIFEEKSSGNIDVAMKLYTSLAFSQELAVVNGSRHVEADTPLYVGFSLNRTQFDRLSVFPVRCLSNRISANDLSTDQLILITNGCVTAHGVQILEPKHGEYRFSYMPVSKESLSPRGVVHCEVLICSDMDGSSRCAPDCDNGNSATREKRYVTKDHIISSQSESFVLKSSKPDP